MSRSQERSYPNHRTDHIDDYYNVDQHATDADFWWDVWWLIHERVRCDMWSPDGLEAMKFITGELGKFYKAKFDQFIKEAADKYP